MRRTTVVLPDDGEAYVLVSMKHMSQYEDSLRDALLRIYIIAILLPVFFGAGVVLGVNL